MSVSVGNLFRAVLLILGVLLMQSCEIEKPTAFSVDVVDWETGEEIPGVTLLVSVYEKTSFLSLPGIIRQDTIETDGQGHFSLVVPYDERFSRFTINVLKEIASDIYVYVNGKKDCSPYDCSSFFRGHAYKFKLKIPLDSL